MSNHSTTTQALAYDLVVYAGRLVRLVRRGSDRTSAASRVLSMLDELGPTTVSALAEADRCAQPTMSGLVNGLVERGLLARRRNPEDSRSSLVSLTDAGRAELGTTRGDYADLVAERAASTGLTTEELELTVSVLGDLVQQRTGHREHAGRTPDDDSIQPPDDHPLEIRPAGSEAIHS